MAPSIDILIKTKNIADDYDEVLESINANDIDILGELVTKEVIEAIKDAINSLLCSLKYVTMLYFLSYNSHAEIAKCVIQLKNLVFCYIKKVKLYLAGMCLMLCLGLPGRGKVEWEKSQYH